MSEPTPPATATPGPRRAASSGAEPARRQAFAVSPAIGPLPAIYVPSGPRRACGLVPLLRARLRLALQAGGLLPRHLGRRRRSAGPAADVLARHYPPPGT
jgi:hypothetical protein